MFRWRAPSRTQRLVAVLLAAGALAGGVKYATGSDHQDTPLVELNPRMDLTDVYAFPGSAPGRIVLVMNTSGFLSPGQTATAAFDPNILYQFKIDNDGDAKEDRVIQVTFAGKDVPWLMKLIVDHLSHPAAQAVAVPYGLLVGYGAVRFASVLLRENRDSVFGRVSVRAMRRLSLSK